MKVVVTRQTDSWYTETKSIEVDVPDDTKDIESFIKDYLEEDGEDDFSDADTDDDEFSDPEHQWDSIRIDGVEKQWQNY